MAEAIHQLSVVEPHLRNLGQHAQGGAPVIKGLNALRQLDSVRELLRVVLVGERLHSWIPKSSKTVEGSLSPMP